MGGHVKTHYYYESIAKSQDYDDSTLPMTQAGLNAEEIYYQLAVEDIEAVADLRVLSIGDLYAIIDEIKKKNFQVSIDPSGKDSISFA